MALRVFQSARAALESTRGTGLTPTRLIYAEEMAFEQTVATISPTELRNSYNPKYSASAGPEANTITMAGRVSYDDLGWWANLFVKGGVSPTGAGADRTFTFLPTATSDDVKSATIQLGYTDTIATAPAIEQQFVMGSTFNLHFEKNDDGAATFNATLFGGEAMTQITAFTGALSDRVVTLASCNNTTFFADQASAIGTTPDTTFVSLDWNLDLGPVRFYTLDGTVAPKAIFRPNHRTWEATIVRQFTNDTLWDDYQDKTVQKIRCRTTGPVLGGSNYKIDLDLYGVITNRVESDVDGIITEELTIQQIYDTTATADHVLVVVNANTVAYT